MFHSQSRYPNPNPRDKYVAALEAVKAAEAEYLAAQRLQDEEDSLRQRLDQIRLLKQREFAGYSAPQSHYTNPTPPSAFGTDFEGLRRQIAAEERARIALEQQQQARQLEAIRKYEEERRASEHQLRLKAQLARENERARALAVQRARLEALTRRASRPTVRFNIVGEEEEPVRKHHCRHQHAPVRRPHNALEVQDLLSQAFAGRVQKPRAPVAPAPATRESINLQDFLGQLLGTQIPTPQPKPAAKQAEAARQTVTLEQLLGHILGASGVDIQPSVPVASTSTSQAAPSEKKEAAPAPSQPAPTPAAAPRPTAHPQPAHLFNQFLGGAQAQTDYEQLINMFFGAHPEVHTPKAPEASSSKPAETGSSSSLKQQSAEERDLAEAIRLSLAEAAPASSSSDKGKAPAPAPAVDIASSTAEVRSIDASFNTLAADFAFPDELDFSKSRAASPTRDGQEPSAISRLSYSARNHAVREHHQALSALLARLDAVESFGDEGLRHARKEAVGRVEGALDEVEGVIESRWRKWAGKERVESPAPAVEAAAVIDPVEPVDEPEPALAADVSAQSAVDAVEQTPSYPPTVDDTFRPSSPIGEHAPALPVAELAASDSDALDAVPPPVDLASESFNTVGQVPAADVPAESVSDSESGDAVGQTPSYPPTVDVASESSDTLRPSSPISSDVDTVLLPATSESDAQPLNTPTSLDEDVASDWSEVEA
ncbi:hypothetical protein FB45DRAFT_1067148 [Roridomyces roridus]|uniref:BAG domain-containing protein n=1 Tax=Roridomyces roridus TaxID=1738132 RepID=A0AAD7B2Y6_9AGAR|nr:hypothetical protein FB45DRAFT_1067148 [Roridomyces roridus]